MPHGSHASRPKTLRSLRSVPVFASACARPSPSLLRLLTPLVLLLLMGRREGPGEEEPHSRGNGPPPPPPPPPDRGGGEQLPRGLGRVEYLPVEWHTRFKGRLYREGGGGEGGKDSGGGLGGSTRRGSMGGRGAGGRGRGEGGEGGGRRGGGDDRGSGGGGNGGLSIWDITLPRAPTLRAFTNDTLLDILYFMSPEYHQVRSSKNRQRRSYDRICERACARVSLGPPCVLFFVSCCRSIADQAQSTGLHRGTIAQR